MVKNDHSKICVFPSLSESSACSTVLKETQEPWVHALPIPDLYRGPHREKDQDASAKYFEEARAVIEARLVDGAKIAALLMEPIFTFHGMTLAQPEYMQKLVAYVRSLGALVIIDEVQGGLGRYKTDHKCTTSRRLLVSELERCGLTSTWGLCQTSWCAASHFPPGFLLQSWPPGRRLRSPSTRLPVI